MRKFHDEDYDGIVLRIPDFFIKVNSMEADMETIKKMFSREGLLSTMHPDHTKNLNELDMYKDKKELIDLENAAWQRKVDTREEYNRKVQSGEIMQLEWHNRKASDMYLDQEVTINGESIPWDNMYNSKSLKADFKKLLQDYINNFDDFLKFAKENNGWTEISIDTTMGCKPKFFRDIKVYLNSNYQVGIKYDRLMVRKFTSQRMYRRYPLCERDGVLYMNDTNGEDKTSLKEFKMEGMTLVKSNK